MKRVTLIVSVVLCLFLLSMGCVCYGATSASAPTMTVHVYVPEKWSDPYIFSWNKASGPTLEWPGIEMTQEDGRWFVADIPSFGDHFLINDGPGGNGEKTRDLPYLTDGSEIWVIIRGVDDEGHYFADITYYPPDAPDLEEDPPVQGDVITVHAFVPFEWTDPHIYSWPTGGEDVLPWPGKAMEQEDGRWFSQEIPFYHNNLIINNGDGIEAGQTQDLRFDTDDPEIWVVIGDGFDAAVYYDEPDLDQPYPPVIEYCYGSTSTSVRVKWTGVEGVDGYELYMSTDPDDLRSYELVKRVKDPSTLSYTKGSLAPGRTYYFRVCSYVLLGDGVTRMRSSLSDAKYCVPAVLWDAPYSNSDFRIRLRWEPVEGADGFQIWRKGEGEDYRVVKTVRDGQTIAYSNVGLKSGGTYTYRMRAYFINEDGSRSYGTYSDEITVGVQPSKPEVTVKSTKAGRVQVSWDDLYGASAYQVWMSDRPDGGFGIVKSIYDGDVTSYTKSGLESGKTYYFKVRASVEVDGKKTFGAYSEVIAVTVR